MKTLLTMIGLILLLGGIAIVGYHGVFHYGTQEKIAQIGDVQVTANTEKVVYLPPILGGISIVAGLVLVVIAKNRKI